MGGTFIAVVILLLVLVPNFQVVLITLSCVTFTVINVAGFSHFMGLTIETVTSIILILSLGLAVDYAAHIAITFVCIKSGTRQEKAQITMEAMAAAVWNGGFSTFLAFVLVAGSKSYVFATFFKMFAMVVLFGLYHGLIFLPVALSLIGPQSTKKRNSVTGATNLGFDNNQVVTSL